MELGHPNTGAAGQGMRAAPCAECEAARQRAVIIAGVVILGAFAAGFVLSQCVINLGIQTGFGS